MFSRQIRSIMVAGLFASCVLAQGLQTKATKDDWEEINFEFNSSILSDGYPTLLRLAELLQQNRDFKVQVEGHTDYVGSESYNEKLALARAGTVRDFLTKYGAGTGQVSVSGQGKRTPEVPNTTKEGRFINRRVVLTVTDGTGKIIASGSGPQVVTTLDDRLKKLEDCCNAILKKLDKLDEILSAIRDLKAENDKLKADVAALQNRPAPAPAAPQGPRPLTADETSQIVKTEATNAANAALAQAEANRKRFSLLGLNVGPTTYGDLTFTGSGRYFAPFKQNYALQVQGEYMYHGGGASRIEGRQEGQFDIGLIDRIGNFQAGLFSSFKYVNFGQYDSGGTLGQGALTMDYIFKRGRVGLYGTKGFRNTAVVNRAQLGPSSYLETYLRVADQIGGSALVGAWGDAYFEGNLGYVKLHGTSDNSRPGGMIRLVQPIKPQIAFTLEAGLNESLVTSANSGRIVFGVQFGNWLRPKEFHDVTHPVPVDIPRVRYQLLTRRVGNSSPVADAGPNQTIQAGTATLNGSGSYDPDGDPLTYQWTQISGPNVSITGQNTATANFPAGAGLTYSFRLTVKDPGGLQGTSSTTVTVGNPNITVTRFTATPPSIASGASSLLEWSVTGSTDVTITPDIGAVAAQGSRSVSPTETTTYTLVAKVGTVEQRATATVTVGTSDPRILRFEATPTNINSGESSTLSWATDGATSVTISGITGTLGTSGSRPVSPTQTTTYTLTATGADGRSVSAPVVVTVGGAGGTARILQFALNPTTIDGGGSSQLCWQVENATTVSITPGIGTVKTTDCVSVSPASTTTYVLTATNAAGSATASATLTVGGVKVLTFTNSPEYSTSAGDPVVLSWTTTGATSVIITGFGIPAGTLPVNGSLTVNPRTNVDYTLTAYGPGGRTVSVVIHVFVR